MIIDAIVQPVQKRSLYRVSVTLLIAGYENPCPCSPFPYVLPDSYSNENKKFWALKEAWKDGRPLVWNESEAIFQKLESRGPKAGPQVVGVVKATDTQEYIVLKGDQTATYQQELSFVGAGAIEGFEEEIFVSIRDGANKGDYRVVGNGDVFVTDDPDDLNLGLFEFPAGIHTYIPTEQNQGLELKEWIEIEDVDDSYGLMATNTPDPVYLLDPRQVIFDHVEKTTELTEDECGDPRFVTTGDPCDPKPCVRHIAPAGQFCSTAVVGNDISVRGKCTAVVGSDEFTISGEGIYLNTQCTEICDKQPILRRAD